MADGPIDPSKTTLVHSGRQVPAAVGKSFNPPVVRLSTVVFDDLASMRGAEAAGELSYGANGNPTAFALEELITDLEGGHGTRLFPTGLAAVAQMFMAFVQPGDHVLITDAVYSPVRRFVKTFLEPWGVAVEYYAADGSDVAGRFKHNTRMLYAEVPGSLAFEMCDLPALSTLCKANGALLAVDNSWGSGVIYRPLTLGADISLMALTKYVAGHSDVMMGSVTTCEALWPRLKAMNTALGNTVSPDDAYLVLRGARTLAARLEMHQRHAMEVALWLREQPQVARVMYPPLRDDPGHALWQRDCQGGNGLLSFEFADGPDQQVEPFIAALRVFSLGYSWGGFESLVSVVDRGARSLADWSARGPVLRLHIGLERPDDLIADLRRGFAALS